MTETFDFVVVGGGSAGAVIAARLTEDPACRVALLEAGGRPPAEELVPVVCPMLQRQPATDWMYTADAGRCGLGLEGGRMMMPRGRMLGGSSGMNYMAYVRGHPGDFDAWAAGGATGWSYGDVLPLFMKSEGLAPSDDVVIDAQEIAASGLDYLALGHWHSTLRARAGDVEYAYPGAPEPIAVDQDGAGNVLLVTLESVNGRRQVTVEERPVGRTRFQRIAVDAGDVASQAALVERLLRQADSDLVLDVRLTGVRPDDLDIDIDEVEAALAKAFYKVRARDASVAPLSAAPLPPFDTIAGAFIRDVEGRIAELGAQAQEGNEARELREVLRLGRLLLAGHEVTL